MAFIRKYRALNLVAEEANKVYDALADLVGKYPPSQDPYQKMQFYSSLRLLYVIAYLLTCTFIVFVVVAILYITFISRILFSSLIVWRGINIIDDSFYVKMAEFADSISETLNLTYVSYAIWPFIKLMQYLSSIQIDLGEVEVTCAGSQAPMQLLINCFILGFIIIIIESDFFLFQNIFQQTNFKFVRTTMLFKLGMPNKYKILVVCLLSGSIAQLNLPAKALQFIMSVIYFTEFVKKDYAAHEHSDHCDKIAPLYLVDSILAKIASIMAWYLLFPAIYCLSKVLVPHGENLPKEISNHMRDVLLKYEKDDVNHDCEIAETIPGENGDFENNDESILPTTATIGTQVNFDKSLLQSIQEKGLHVGNHSHSLFSKLMKLSSLISPDIWLAVFSMKWLSDLRSKILASSKCEGKVAISHISCENMANVEILSNQHFNYYYIFLHE